MRVTGNTGNGITRATERVDVRGQFSAHRGENLAPTSRPRRWPCCERRSRRVPGRTDVEHARALIVLDVDGALARSASRRGPLGGCEWTVPEPGLAELHELFTQIIGSESSDLRHARDSRIVFALLAFGRAAPVHYLQLHTADQRIGLCQDQGRRWIRCRRLDRRYGGALDADAA